MEAVKIDDSGIGYVKKNMVDKDSQMKLTAQISPENATGQNVTWSSNDEKVMKVTDGKFRIVGKGKVILTAMADNGVMDEIEIEVIDSSGTAVKSVAGFGAVIVAGIVLLKKRRRLSK